MHNIKSYLYDETSLELEKNNIRSPTNKATISKTKKVLKKVGVVGNRENRTLPKAIDPTRKVINFIRNIPTLLLNIPIKQAKPIQKFNPPYMPAISEQPISEVTDNPIATEKLGQPRSNAPATGSKRAQMPI